MVRNCCHAENWESRVVPQPHPPLRTVFSEDASWDLNVMTEEVTDDQWEEIIVKETAKAVWEWTLRIPKTWEKTSTEEKTYIASGITWPTAFGSMPFHCKLANRISRNGFLFPISPWFKSLSWNARRWKLQQMPSELISAPVTPWAVIFRNEENLAHKRNTRLNTRCTLV